MNCAKSVKMIVILGCIVVNLVGCGMNDTTASSMSTVVSSQDTSSSSCKSEEKNDLQDFSQTLVDSTSVFLDQDQYTVFEKAQKIDYALWGQSSNLKGLNFKIEDAPTFVPMTQNAPTYVKLNGHDYEVYQNSYKEFEEYMKSIFTNDFLSQDSIEKKFVNYNGKLAVCDDYDLAQIPYFTGYVGEYYPDDFCSVRYYLKNKTEAQVNFVMIAYYNPNETYEEHDEYSYDDMNKVEYEMQLVKVGDVWRVNKYHSPELG